MYLNLAWKMDLCILFFDDLAPDPPLEFMLEVSKGGNDDRHGPPDSPEGTDLLHQVQREGLDCSAYFQHPRVDQKLHEHPKNPAFEKGPFGRNLERKKIPESLCLSLLKTRFYLEKHEEVMYEKRGRKRGL